MTQPFGSSPFFNHCSQHKWYFQILKTFSFSAKKEQWWSEFSFLLLPTSILLFTSPKTKTALNKVNSAFILVILTCNPTFLLTLISSCHLPDSVDFYDNFCPHSMRLEKTTTEFSSIRNTFECCSQRYWVLHHSAHKMVWLKKPKDKAKLCF